ncbi:hypothetical protein CR194_03330 [Salipaludibacillus keqinensis]|uniref:Uncharacterized protein n=1 Tax=Salipaludibacillus keqinensis TaxID=2045207 RepID=A0A323TIA3_9BACI|nr:hypothetical protein [Salipaludibacillus keqinensis]PYZ94578.1 hypothetical protein CR194_03330 [Salipaludibacillus keqinensis]
MNFRHSFYYKGRLLRSSVISVVCLIIYLLAKGLLDMIHHSYYTFSITGLMFVYLSCLLMIFFVSLLFDQFSLGIKAKFFSLFFYLFFLTGGAQGLIHIIMHTEVNVLVLLGLSGFTSLIISTMMIVVFPASLKKRQSYIDQLRRYYKRRPLMNWIIRMTCGMFFLFITYYLLNSMIFPFIEPYYLSSGTPFLVQEGNYQAIERAAMATYSLMMIVAFIPLFALWKGSKSSLLFWFGFPLFVLVALQPFLLFFHWPLGFRFPIFIQTTLVIYIQTIILVQMFYLPSEYQEEEYFFLVLNSLKL